LANPLFLYSCTKRLISHSATFVSLFLVLSFVLASTVNSHAEVCSRFASGSEIASPHEIKSKNSVLDLTLSLRKSVETNGEVRYCYVDADGNESPTLRVKPGDLLILKLKNELPEIQSSLHSHDTNLPCGSGAMAASATNLHFHGLMIPPDCHEDDVLKTSIRGGATFEYRFQIPRDQPPGLYWYHPHPHGHSEEQVLGGASGALIVEGIEAFNPSLAGLPERLIVVRDQVRANSGGVLKPPSKDLSVNFVPVPYPDYPPAIIKTKPLQRELWKVLNASADTFLEFHLLTNGKWQNMGLVALDGVPIGDEEKGGNKRIEWKEAISIPPGGRAEFLFDSPVEDGRTQVLTAGVDTVPFVDDDDPAFAGTTNKPVVDDDDYTPPRWIINVLSTKDAVEPTSVLPKSSSTEPSQREHTPFLISVKPSHTRQLYFSEKVFDPKTPRTSTAFYLTEDGQKSAVFDPAAAPNLTVRQGDVEDWIIENRSQEVHTFHIHQTHFVVMERDGKAVEENYLRDTVALPYWDGSSPYPSVKLRIDFRNVEAGTFPYHCHILQHEDGGMMGTVQVVKADSKKRTN
jgi:FtsP/CotA-like multicopper oxidase with cupredoxin domain